MWLLIGNLVPRVLILAPPWERGWLIGPSIPVVIFSAFRNPSDLYAVQKLYSCCFFAQLGLTKYSEIHKHLACVQRAYKHPAFIKITVNNDLF
jgi:hypothetical protein